MYLCSQEVTAFIAGTNKRTIADLLQCTEQAKEKCESACATATNAIGEHSAAILTQLKALVTETKQSKIESKVSVVGAIHSHLRSID